MGPPIHAKNKFMEIDFESASRPPSGVWWLDDKIIKEPMSLMSL